MLGYHDAWREMFLPALVLICAFLLLALFARWSYKARRILAPASIVLFIALLLLQYHFYFDYLVNPASIVMSVCFVLCVAAVGYLCFCLHRISRKELKDRYDIGRRARIANSLVFLVAAALAFVCIAISSSKIYYHQYVYDCIPDETAYNWMESVVKFSLLFTFVIVLTDGFIGQICSPIFTVDVIGSLERFNLYLRSFDADSSSAKKEKMLCRSFDRLFQTYAIGNPNAVLQPLGARRIYAADDEWQHAVGTMMDKARLVIMRCATTDGAMWELNRLLSRPELLRKCVFVVDSAEAYDRLCKGLSSAGYISSCLQPDFEKGQYGIMLIHSDEAYRLYSAPLDSAADMRAFIKYITTHIESIGREHRSMKRMQHMVLFKLFSDEIPEKVRHSINWTTLSPVISWRHWPLYYWAFFAGFVMLWPYAGMVPVIVYLLFMVFIGNRIEWAQRPDAGPVLFMKRQRREAWLMWGSLLFAILCAFLALIII